MPTLPDGSSSRSDTRLDSWKQIAAHVNRHVTTVRRWEKHEGLPVHRHVHSALSSIYAYTSELDAWLVTRQPAEAISSAERDAIAPATVPRSTLAPNSFSHFVPSPITLLGREGEIQTFADIWRNSSAGRQQIAVISGEVGQGKTRLALEFACLATSQANILTSVWDREGLIPFAPFIAILRSIIKTVGSSTFRRMMVEIAGSQELAQLVPEVKTGIARTEPKFQVPAASRRVLMFEAFAQLLVALSRDCPILIILEGLHWADAGSLLFLRHLIRSTKEARLCILLTYRENEPCTGALSEKQFEEFHRDFAITRLRLRGLTSDEVRLFVDAWMGREESSQLVDWIIATTGGNPLFITELLTHLGETGILNGQLSTGPIGDFRPLDQVREVIRHRIRRLSPLCKKILTFGAVAGREFSLPLMEHLIDSPEDILLSALEEAIAAKVVTEARGIPGRFCFTHALIGETLYADTMAAHRARLHHRVGEALERRSAAQMLPFEELAYHFTESGFYDISKAIEYAVRAGDFAQNRLALEEAVRYYGMALRTLSSLPLSAVIRGKQAELHAKSGRSWFQAGQWTCAKADFVTALSLLNPEELEERCELLVRIAETSFWLMDVPALRRFAREAELLADRIGRNDLWADARAWTASAQVSDGDVLGGIASDVETLSRVGKIKSFGLARAPLTLYWVGRAAEAVPMAEQAVESARASTDPGFLLYALQHLGICLSGLGRYDEALLAFDEACAFGRQCGASALLARATSMSVAPLFSLGEFARAASRAMEAREIARGAAFDPPLTSAGIDLLFIYARTHDPGRAESLLVELGRAVDEAGNWHAWKWKMRLCQARAELAFSRGEWEAAIQFADDVIEQSNWRHRPKYQAMALMVRARARRALGLQKALEDAKASVEVARRVADPSLLAECLSVLLLEDETEELCAETRRVTDSVLHRVSDASLQRSFLAKLEANGSRVTSREVHFVKMRSHG
jgi:tetratricopeptide (TPR) repeat protein